MAEVTEALQVILMRETAGSEEFLDQAELLDMADLTTDQARPGIEELRERGVLRESEEGYGWKDPAEAFFDEPTQEQPTEVLAAEGTRYEVRLELLVPFTARGDDEAKKAAAEITEEFPVPVDGTTVELKEVLAYAAPRRIT